MTYYRFMDDDDYDVYGVLGFDLDDTIENHIMIQEDIVKFNEEFEKNPKGYETEYVINKLVEKYNCEVIVWNESPLYI